VVWSADGKARTSCEPAPYYSVGSIRGPPVAGFVDLVRDVGEMTGFAIHLPITVKNGMFNKKYGKAVGNRRCWVCSIANKIYNKRSPRRVSHAHTTTNAGEQMKKPRRKNTLSQKKKHTHNPHHPHTHAACPEKESQVTKRGGRCRRRGAPKSSGPTGSASRSTRCATCSRRGWSAVASPPPCTSAARPPTRPRHPPFPPTASTASWHWQRRRCP